MSFFLFSAQPKSQSLHIGHGSVYVKCSDSNENISGVGEEHQHKHRCFESALARAGSDDPGLESTALGWGNQPPTPDNQRRLMLPGQQPHKLQFTFLRLRTEAPSGPSFLVKPCRLPLNQFSHSLSELCSTQSADHVCHSQYHCDTNPGGSKGLTQ